MKSVTIALSLMTLMSSFAQAQTMAGALPASAQPITNRRDVVLTPDQMRNHFPIKGTPFTDPVIVSDPTPGHTETLANPPKSTPQSKDRGPSAYGDNSTKVN